MRNYLKLLVLLLLGAFLYTRLLNNSILFYIHERFTTLTLLAAVGLLLVGISYVRVSDSTTLQTSEFAHNRNLSWVGLLLISLPFIFGSVVEPQPLGAEAVDNRDIGLGSLTSLSAPTGQGMGLLAGERNIVDWLVQFQQNEASTFEGQEANVIGFVYRDDRFSSEEFLVSRFLMSCCVADASPVGLIVSWADAESLPDDGWVQVSGTFVVGEFNGLEMPILIPDTVTKTEAPAQPYLYR